MSTQSSIHPQPVPVWIVVAGIIVVIILILTAVSKGATSNDENKVQSISLRQDSAVETGKQQLPPPSLRACDNANALQSSLVLTSIVRRVERVDSKIAALSNRCRRLEYLIADEHKRVDERILSAEDAITSASGKTISLENTFATTGEQLLSGIAETSKSGQETLDQIIAMHRMLLSLICLAVIAVVILVFNAIRCARVQAMQHKQEQDAGTATHDEHPPSDVSQRSTIPLPESALQDLIGLASINPLITNKPALIPAGWNAAICTSRGRVRAENQDYGFMFGIGDHLVSASSDGMAGHPNGGKASCIGVKTAAAYLIYQLGQNPPEGSIPDIVNQSLLSACHALALEALNNASSGLRTTLIVVVATPSNYYFTHIGDGGGMIIRRNGDVERFLIPQKAPGPALNILAASLGPVMQGSPRSGCLPVLPGDLLMAGSDGVFDHIDEEFVPGILNAIEAFNGDVKRVAETAIRNFEEAEDEFGLLCKDNLTLALALRTDQVKAI